MKNIRARHIASVFGIVIALFAFVYGSYKPFIKSQRFIHGLQQLQVIRSMSAFKEAFDPVFSFSSPVGEEEAAKFLSYDILGIIRQPGQSEEVARGLVEYIEPYIEKTDVRHLLSLGQMYVILWNAYGHEADYVIAERYYRDALAMGPKLPPVLFALFTLYQQRGDSEKLNEIALTIKAYWPEAIHETVRGEQ